MKRILYVLLAVVMCFTMAITVSAETNQTSFTLTNNTGFISFENVTTISTNFIPAIPVDDSIVIKTNSDALTVTKVVLIVDGERYGRNYSEKVEYNFTNYTDANCAQKATSGGRYWKLDLFTNTAYGGGFLVDSFSRIYNITITTEAYCKTDSEQVYYDYGNKVKTYAAGRIFTLVTNFTSNTDITNIIGDLVTNASDFNYTYKEVYFDYPFLSATDRDNDGLISRAEIECLSYSELGTGKGIAGFEGLASQVAAFFNKKDNGKITFKITTAPSIIIADWNNGGVPVYTTGIFNPTTAINTDNLIGLFFNYETTGSLVSASKINGDGTITFDITNVLNDMGGNTLATLRSIYYGLIGGINYSGYPVRGIKVESVILSCDDKVEEEVEAVIPVVDDNESDEEIEEDEEEIVVIDEDEDEEEPTVEIVTDDETDEEDATIVDERTVVEAVDDVDDENPRTGVALVIVPAFVAGVAVLLSRKRK